MKLQVKIYKGLRYVYFKVAFVYSLAITKFKLWLNGVAIPLGLGARGIPIINVSSGGTLVLGKNFRFNSGQYYNMIGRQQKLILIVVSNGRLEIGNNVGISCSAIICHNHIKIGSNVRIGGNCVIYDTDFHDLNLSNRILMDGVNSAEDSSKVNTNPVIIKDGVFIGAHSTILKGVIIGENSIIGAGSVVAKNIPENEIWAGNPARFLRTINSI